MVKVSKKNLIVPELEKKEKASVNVEGDAASSDSEDEQELRKAVSKVTQNVQAERIKALKERGVIYIGHIPQGFCEPQLKQFFAQFGVVTRLRLSRSKKTGRPKGYAFLEFELAEVADIVAKTMDKYLLYGRQLAVKVVPKDELKGRQLFKNCNRKIRPTGRANVKKERELRERKAAQLDARVVTSRQVNRRTGKADKRKAVLEALGLQDSCNFVGQTVSGAKKEVKRPEVQPEGGAGPPAAPPALKSALKKPQTVNTQQEAVAPAMTSSSTEKKALKGMKTVKSAPAAAEVKEVSGKKPVGAKKKTLKKKKKAVK